MNSPSVASPPAASSDPPFRYPAANPATAATVPHTSASPNLARHARHHRPVLATVPWPAAAPAASPRAASPQPVAVCTALLAPRIPGTDEGAREAVKYGQAVITCS